MVEKSWSPSAANSPGDSPSRASGRLGVKPVKESSRDRRGLGNNATYDEVEQAERRLARQDAAIALAQHATTILRSQTDPEVLDLHSYAGEMTDVLLNEIANQLRVNLLEITKRSAHRHDIAKAFYSAVILSGCDKITPVGMRAFIHILGPTIRRLNYSHSIVPVSVLKVMATCIECLDALDFSQCPQLTAEGIHEFICCCSHSLSKLNLSSCPRLNDDAMGWIAGALGPQGSLTQCSKLLSLDISYTPMISDRGLGHLGSGCKTIQFLNLEGMERITNTGILRVLQGCRHLRVLSLRKCLQLTDASLRHIGQHGANLRSLNFSCCYNFSSAGLLAMVGGTPQLQSLNLEGCRNMREDILAALALHCLNLQVLNLDGCQEITDNGITTLAEHMPYVTRARAYRGLEPRPDGLHIKFCVQQKTIQNSAALRIQSIFRGHVGRRLAATWRLERLEIPAASRIRKNYACYRLNKEINARARRSRALRESATKIQSMVRGVLCRIWLQRQEEDERRLKAWAKSAVKIQTIYRSHWTRRHLPLVFKTIQRYRREQLLLKEQAAVIRLQRAFRKRYNRSRFDDVMAIQRRRRQERIAAAITLQRLFRTRATRKAYRRLREVMQQQHEKVREVVKYAIKLQSQWRGHRGRREVVRAREEMARRERRKHNAASRINAGVRGYFARRYVQVERVRQQTRNRAARAIQRAWRLYKSPSPERINFEKMLVKMRSQVLEENLAAQKKQEAWLKKAKELFERDSASDPESEDDWRDFWDDNGYQFWFSPSRNERHYVRPNDFAYEKCMLGMLCRVFWPMEQQWFNGRIVQYNRHKDKHKVVYDDGDHEWLCLKLDADRVQLHNGFCWTMCRMFEPAMRTLKAAIYLMLRIQHYDHRYLGWRSGQIRAYNEQSDTFLVKYDDDAMGAGPTAEEWVDLFRQEHAVQVQDAVTLQWSSLSGYVFGSSLGRPVGNLKQSELAYYYSVDDYLVFVEQTAAVEEPVTETGDDLMEAVISSNVGGIEVYDPGEDGDNELQDDEHDEEADAADHSNDGDSDKDGGDEEDEEEDDEEVEEEEEEEESDQDEEDEVEE